MALPQRCSLTTSIDPFAGTFNPLMLHFCIIRSVRDFLHAPMCCAWWLQRINGRIAMIAFAGAAAAEAASGKSILEQASIAPISVLITVFLISLGSLFPKFAAGVPLSQLTDATGGSI